MNQDVENGKSGSSVASFFVFLKHLITDPATIGAACPSSVYLTRKMASFVSPSPHATVLELGPGTGVVTKALIERGVALDQLVAVERMPEMADFLKKQFPGLNVLAGDACHLDQLLKGRPWGKGGDVQYVVSSLPLRSIPKPVVQEIMKQIDMLLAKDGKYIQFTYDLRPKPPLCLENFKRVDSGIVFRNFPPARVDVFQRCENKPG